MRPATQQEIERWDELVMANPDGGNVLQLRAFAQTKAKHGWTPKYFVLGKVAVIVLSRHIPLLGEYWYVPKGPGVTTRKELAVFAAKLPVPRPFAVRIDPERTTDQLSQKQLAALGFVRSPRDIQYNTNTVIIDLRPPEEDILASFKQKTRYNVRLAGKKGVRVEAVPTNQESIDVMYELTRAMTERAGVYLRDKQYFTDFYTEHSATGRGQMFFAKYEGKVLAGAYITYTEHQALYKDGGSVREHPEVQAPYALQWGIMQWLKAQGVVEYDLHGTPPASQIADQNHPLAGLARFKTGFNQTITEYIGTFDLPVNPVKYLLWKKVFERIANAYEHRVKNRLFY